MRNIKFKGIYRDESQLQKSEMQANGIKFKEPESLNAFMAKGFLCSLALVIAVLCIAGFEIYKLLMFSDIGKNEIIQSVVISVIVIVIGQFVHELIHALFFPGKDLKEIYISRDFTALFVYCTAAISKILFIVMSLAPNVILGIIPLFIGLLCGGIPIIQIRIVLLLAGCILTIAGIGDYYNVYNAMNQVPKDAVIFSSGMHSYWQGEDVIEESTPQSAYKPFLVIMYTLGSILLRLDLKIYLLVFFLIIMISTFYKGVFSEIVKWGSLIVILAAYIGNLF